MLLFTNDLIRTFCVINEQEVKGIGFQNILRNAMVIIIPLKNRINCIIILNHFCQKRCQNFGIFSIGR
jgi:hypothetical protein